MGNELKLRPAGTENNPYELPSYIDTKGLIGDIHKSAIISEVKENKEIKEKFIGQAIRSVDNELSSLNQESIARRKKTAFEANRDSCLIYGIDEHVAFWQVLLMRLGAGFWFIIYWVFASVTIAPVNVFFRGIRTFIKNNYIVLIFAVLCYLIIILGIPLIISLI